MSVPTASIRFRRIKIVASSMTSRSLFMVKTRTPLTAITDLGAATSNSMDRSVFCAVSFSAGPASPASPASPVSPVRMSSSDFS